MTPDRDDPAPLAHLGYDAFFAKQLVALGPDLAPARIVGQHRREWDVHDGQQIERAVLAGRRWSPTKGARNDEAQPTIGDWVALSLKPGQRPVIEHILARKTFLARTSVARRGQRQVLVANVDVIAVVSAFSPPDVTDSVAKRSLHPRRIERYLAAIQPGGAEGLVVLNKADLHPDTSRIADELSIRLTGAKVLSICAKEPFGLNSLREHLSVGKTIGFVGLSGVGKSSIVNALLGRDVQKVMAAREDDARGRHTTTHRSLFVSEEGFLLIDTPGMRELAISDTDDADLSSFGDIVALSAACRFRNCTHLKEPGCAVVSAVSGGELDSDRLVSYRGLAQELTANTSADPARRPHPRTNAPRKSKPKRQRDDDWMD